MTRLLGLGVMAMLLLACDPPLPDAAPKPATVQIRGVVEGPPSSSVDGLYVRVDDELPVPCTSEGAFVLSVAVGTHRVTVTDVLGRSVGEPEIYKVGPTPPPMVLRIPRTYLLVGSVVNAVGDPVAALAIVFTHASGKPAGFGGALTESDGQFRTRVPYPGEYFAHHKTLTLRGTLSVGEEDALLVYQPAAPDDFLVHVYGPDGLPVRDARLTVVSGAATSPGRRPGSEYPVVDGEFRAPAKVWGWPRLVDIHIERVKDVDGRIVKYAMFVATNVDTRAGEVDLRLEYGRDVRGLVVDESSKPMAGMSIRAFHPHIQRYGQLATATSDADGVFVLRGVPSCALWLYVSPPGRSSDLRMDLPANDTACTLMFRRGHPLRIVVLNDAGRPVVPTMVYARWRLNGIDSHRHASTNKDGRAAFAHVPKEARVQIRVHTNWIANDISVGEGTQTIQIPKPVVIRGRLTGDASQFGRVSVLRAEGVGAANRWFVDQVQPDSRTGAFEFRCPLPGTYRLWIQYAPRTPSKPVVVVAPQSDVRIPLPASVPVLGRLVAEDPHRWSARWFQEPVPSVAPIGFRGRFRLDRVRPERGTLMAIQEGGGAIAIAENVDPTDGPFVLRPVKGQAIRGRVEGVLLSSTLDVRVTIRRGTIVFPATLQSDGRFEATGLPPGAWTVRLWVRGVVDDEALNVNQDTSDLVLRASR